MKKEEKPKTDRLLNQLVKNAIVKEILIIMYMQALSLMEIITIERDLRIRSTKKVIKSLRKDPTKIADLTVQEVLLEKRPYTKMPDLRNITDNMVCEMHASLHRLGYNTPEINAAKKIYLKRANNSKMQLSIQKSDESDE
jgi:hypothetical protein